MVDITKLLSTTAAGQLAQAMDAKDGSPGDEKINASIWNQYIDELQEQTGDKNIGKKINGSISLENAMKSITTYAVKAGAKLKQDATELANSWLEKLGGAPNPVAPEPPAAAAPVEAVEEEVAAEPAAGVVDVEEVAETPVAEETVEETVETVTAEEIVTGSGTGEQDVVVQNPPVGGVIETEDPNLPVNVTPPADVPKPRLPEKKVKPPKAKVLRGKGYTKPDLAKKSKQVTDKHGRTVYYDGKGYIKRISDSNGFRLRITRNADGSVEYFNDYEYDQNGNCTRETIRNANGSVRYFYDCEYDAGGNETRGIHRFANGSVNFFFDYEYDADGNETRRICREADGSVEYYEDKIDGKWKEFKPDGTPRVDEFL